MVWWRRQITMEDKGFAKNPRAGSLLNHLGMSFLIRLTKQCRLSASCFIRFSRVRLCNPMDCNLQAPLSMRFSRQEYWCGLSCPPPEDLPDSGIKLTPLVSPAFAGGFFTTRATREVRGLSGAMSIIWGENRIQTP